MVAPVHKNTNVPVILIVCDVILMLEKHIIDILSRFYDGASTFLTQKLLFDAIKKVLAPSKNPLKS
jgi:hypothetical protein